MAFAEDAHARHSSNTFDLCPRSIASFNFQFSIFNLIKEDSTILIDLILDRKAGQPYNAKKFYDAVTSYLDIFPCYIGVARALDGGTEADVITELCDYIKSQDYNLDICDYISSVKWLEDDEVEDAH